MSIVIILLIIAVLIAVTNYRPRAAIATAGAGSRSFCVHVVGVSHRNSDGSSRQKIIKECADGERLELVPEPENPYDPRAIKVCRLTGEQIGYLDTRTASEFCAAYLPAAKIEMVIHKKGTRYHGVIVRLYHPD